MILKTHIYSNCQKKAKKCSALEKLSLVPVVCGIQVVKQNKLSHLH